MTFERNAEELCPRSGRDLHRVGQQLTGIDNPTYPHNTKYGCDQRSPETVIHPVNGTGNEERNVWGNGRHAFVRSRSHTLDGVESPVQHSFHCESASTATTMRNNTIRAPVAVLCGYRLDSNCAETTTSAVVLSSATSGPRLFAKSGKPQTKRRGGGCPASYHFSPFTDTYSV